LGGGNWGDYDPSAPEPAIKVTGRSRICGIQKGYLSGMIDKTAGEVNF